MRKFNKTLSLVLAVLMLCVMMPAASLVTADTANLFINGDFETGDSTG